MKFLDKYLIICGTIGSALFLSTIIILGFIYPGYDHINQYISELGAVGSPVALEMNIFGFLLPGILLILLSLGLYRILGKNITGKLGSIVFIISGIGLSSLAFFQCDPLCSNTSFAGIMHHNISNLSVLLVITALFLFAYSIKTKKFKKYSIYLNALAAADLLFAIIYLTSDIPYPGLIQKLTIAIPLFAVLFNSLKLYKLEK